MNITLVGFMGTGKTSVAKKLAQVMNMKYISTDELIEKKEGRSINDIFAEKGEFYFRDLEKGIVREVSSLDGVVIDAGGGAIIDQENVNNLKANGIMICLQADPDTVLERMKDKKDRPLLNVDDKLAKINELMKKRVAYYQKADYFINTSNLSIDEVVKRIQGFLKNI